MENIVTPVQLPPLTPEASELYTALATAQAEFATPVKNRKAAYGMYADLGAIMAACRPALNKHGLFIGQRVSRADGGLFVETFITHRTGTCISFGELFMPVSTSRGMNEAQAFGSAETYARRYAICAALGIVADDDDDGQSAGPKACEEKQVYTLTPSDIHMAKKAADKGIDAYRQFFAASPKELRLALTTSGEHDRLKSHAADVSAAGGVHA